MKPLHQYMVKCTDRYNNKVDVDGNELILNTEVSEKDYIYVNRIGTIVDVPTIDSLKIPEGSEVVVHHNVFRRWYDMRGIERNSNSYYKDDLYIVDIDQIFAHRSSNEEWMPLPGFNFVKPIKEDGSNKWTRRDEKMLCGTLELLDPNAAIAGLKQGQVIGFTPNSEYEFELNGEKLYRVMSSQIVWYEKDNN